MDGRVQKMMADQMRAYLHKAINGFGLSRQDGRWVSDRRIASLSRRIFDRVDSVEYNRLVDLYWHPDEIPKARENERLLVQLALRLRLDKPPALKVLDIGGKSGTFAFICRSLGHEAWTTDLEAMLHRSPNPELYRLYGVPAFALAIQPHQPIPYTGRTYDLITGFRTRFHSQYPWETGLDHEIHWDVDAWDFFLRDLALHHLSERGRIFFYLGRLQEREKEGRFPPSLRRYFESIGGEIDGVYLLLRDLAAMRTTTR
jgi:hypothetical protein